MTRFCVRVSSALHAQVQHPADEGKRHTEGCLEFVLWNVLTFQRVKRACADEE